MQLGHGAHIPVRRQFADRDEVAGARTIGALALFAREERMVRAGGVLLDGAEQRDAAVERGDGGLWIRGRRHGRLSVEERPVGLVADRRRLAERVAESGAPQRLLLELSVAAGGSTIVLRGQVVGADAFERASLGERDDVVEVPGAQRVGVDALEILEPDQRRAVDVAAGEVARRLEAVGVVRHVTAQCRHDLEDVGGRLVARVRRPRGPAAAGKTRHRSDGSGEQQEAARHFLARIANAFSIFSVASTAAASWSGSTASVE
ncbi:MAG: hypothetical protein M5U32_04960 [Myxococcota bacterium]|nr:hypothetical protein [Myxococcota bacterium]